MILATAMDRAVLIRSADGRDVQVHARLRTHGQIILEAIRGPGELARALHIFHGYGRRREKRTTPSMQAHSTAHVIRRLFFWSDMNFATRMHDVLAALPLAAVAWTPKAVCLELVRALPSSTETLPMVKGIQGMMCTHCHPLSWHAAVEQRAVAFKAGMVETGAPRAAVPLLVALGQVTLAVIPPWPLALVLQAEHRRQYARVFHLLLRLKLAALVAQSGRSGVGEGTPWERFKVSLGIVCCTAPVSVDQAAGHAHRRGTLSFPCSTFPTGASGTSALMPRRGGADPDVAAPGLGLSGRRGGSGTLVRDGARHRRGRHT